ncbi:hypothetical protein SAY87_021675 [Trapa incisa]|uniref:CBS domain-containing protein n=1 Tax=Trapa incisa TaxID=236973 RepID=A0AAN7JTT6_9MYRT|nr:hypothetical protein SAY87_021675 [Trapa incisa]
MALGLFSRRVSDLCLGKPALRALPASSSLREAILALRTAGEPHLSVWSCDHRIDSIKPQSDASSCRCVGKVCMVDIICYLCREENLQRPGDAHNTPLKDILAKSSSSIVRHIEPSSSLLEAIDLILQGAQNLVVPIPNKANTRRKYHGKPQQSATTHHRNGLEFCWLTQEDVIRFLLNSIAAFSPLPALSIAALGLISSDFSAVHYDSPAASALTQISLSLARQTSVAVTYAEGALIGEISPFTLACCDESVAAAIATLSCGDLMAYIDCGGPPEDLIRAVEARLRERNLVGLLETFSLESSSSAPSMSSGGSCYSSSSDEESMGSPKESLARASWYGRSSSYSARMARRSEAIVCHPKSSLVAVMIQAIAHRVNYVWVIEEEEDCSLVGIVTFSGILQAFREQLELRDDDDGLGEM